MSERVVLTIDRVKEALAHIVSPNYAWPEQLLGWQLEFIVYPDGEVIMDFLHPVSGTFWSEELKPLECPYRVDGSAITWRDLKAASIPFMTPCGRVQILNELPPPHLTLVGDPAGLKS